MVSLDEPCGCLGMREGEREREVRGQGEEREFICCTVMPSGTIDWEFVEVKYG
jgi:hypothetical protein